MNDVPLDRGTVPLAITEAGDPLVVPDGAAGWRVKYFRHPKHPELVRQPNGLPLQIPLEATPDEFMELVGRRPGRFRLEPIMASGMVAAENLHAVLVLSPPEETKPAAYRDDRDRLIADLVRSQQEMIANIHEQNQQFVANAHEQNQKLVSTMAEKFGEYLSGAAELIKAQRAPLAPETPKSTLEALQEMAKLKELVNELADTDDNESSPLDALFENEQALANITAMGSGIVNKGMAFVDAKIDKMRAEAHNNGKTLSPEEKVDAIVQHVDDADRDDARSLLVASLSSDEPPKKKAAENLLSMSPKLAAAQLVVELTQERKLVSIMEALSEVEQRIVQAKLAEIAEKAPQKYAALMQVVQTLTVEQAVAEIRKRFTIAPQE